MTATADEAVASGAPAGPAPDRRAGGPLGWLRRLGFRTVSALTLALVIAAAVSSLATYLTLSGVAPLEQSRTIILSLILINFAIGLALMAMIVWNVVGFMLSRRRSSEAGGKLHMRLVALFSLAALVPTIIVAVFSALTLNLGIESWFSERVRNVVDNATAVTEAYVNEQQAILTGDMLAMANDLNRAQALIDTDPLLFSEWLATQAALRYFPAAYVLTSAGEVLSRAEVDRVFGFASPPAASFQAAADGRPITSLNDAQNQMLGLVRLTAFDDGFLFVMRPVDETVLQLRSETRLSLSEYRLAEDTRSQTQLLFALSYLVVALLVLLAAVWMGLRAANRLATPIARLVGAAEKVSAGDLAARVEVPSGDDEIAVLGRAFNRMTGQLQTQRNELIEANEQYDRRRRFTEAVLSGVTAGVIGLDSVGRINLVNRSAVALLGEVRESLVGRRLPEAVPEFASLVRAALDSADGVVQGQVELHRDGVTRNLTARVTSEPGVDETRGFVVTFDDVTELVIAQRMSAWADIARRIAHEIKNPLTPIQLSAERLRRKYASEITSNPDVFHQCTETIIRQVSDIGRMVDEFSAFARMPSAVMKEQDLSELIRHAVFLQRVGFSDIEFELDMPEGHVMHDCDARQISQALINVVKNAGEAVRARMEKERDEGVEPVPGKIRVALMQDDRGVTIEVIDNGCGLPAEHRQRLTEPYMTTRVKGTGLGLAIVKKIMEDHGGALILEDADPDAHGEEGSTGARVVLYLPRRTADESEKKQASQDAAQEGDDDEDALSTAAAKSGGNR
jgi:two-component system nitrogen regulation sensor histidine kinase NtrY